MKFFKTIQFLLFSQLIGAAFYASATILETKCLINKKCGKKVFLLHDGHLINHQEDTKRIVENVRNISQKNGGLRVVIEGTRVFEKEPYINSVLFNVQNQCAKNGYSVDNIDLRIRSSEVSHLKTPFKQLGSLCEQNFKMLNNFFSKKVSSQLIEPRRLLKEQLEKKGLLDILQKITQKNKIEQIGKKFHKHTEIAQKKDNDLFIRPKKEKLLQHEKTLQNEYNYPEMKNILLSSSLDSVEIPLSLIDIEAADKILSNHEKHFVVFVGGNHAKRISTFLTNVCGFENKDNCHFVSKINHTSVNIDNFFEKALADSSPDLKTMEYSRQNKPPAKTIQKITLTVAGLAGVAVIIYKIWKHLKKNK